ncbi:MAG: 6-phosphogluconolactonase [Gemmatimonadales bacterium]
MTSSVIVAAAHEFARTAAGWIADRMGAAIEARKSCAVALCGGSTPVPVLADLVGRSIRWNDVSVYFGDERAVPPDHRDSNFGMARRALLDHVPLDPARVHRMRADRDDLAAAALDYERSLPERLDILMLGLGPDGHTASLFPETPALRPGARIVLAVAAPSPPVTPQVARMTITPLVIEAARNVVVLVAGADKAGIVARVLDGPLDPFALPAQLARGDTWILDHDAARQLKGREEPQ